MFATSSTRRAAAGAASRVTRPPSGDGEAVSDHEPDTPTPAEIIPPLGEQELEALREVGRHWNAVVEPRVDRLRALPVDPSLKRAADGARAGRFSKFAELAPFEPEEEDEVEATAAATKPVSQLGRLVEAVERVVIGPPLRSSAVAHERMRKLVALPVLGSDLFASVAYGPESMLAVLVLAGTSGLRVSLPLAGVLVLLMLAVGASYRQTLTAYPSGAGSYTVAGDNLGERAGVTAAVGLLADYILNVAVSVATGIAAITSAIPSLRPYTVVLGLGMIALLLAGNLRGVREAGNLFAAPTYVFLFAMALLICVGLAQEAGRGFAATPPPPIKPVEGLTVLLVLRAFASGSTSMTGIEAVANAVPAFKPPEWKNARTTMTWMIGILVTIFVGLMLLIHLDGIAWNPNQTLLSQLAHRSFGNGVLYGFIQAATAVMLLFAANTSYNGFPRLLYFMARSEHAPRPFLQMGDRLAFSNGIVVLTIASAAIFAGFNGSLQALIPLFAVGVFVAVTLSQAGMVVHWWRNRGPHWHRSIAINGFGATLTAIVVAVAAVTKFTSGAWVVVVGIPLLVWLCLRVRTHYRLVHDALAVQPLADAVAQPRGAAAEQSGYVPAPASGERQESPEHIQHLMLVAVERLDLANLRALAYAASLEQPLLALHLSPSEEEAERFRNEWETWAVPLRLEIVVSPYRALVAPLAHYVDALQAQRPELTMTVILAELVVSRPWHRLLHSQVAPRLRLALRTRPNIVITTIPFHLPA
jgi:amino acid transporter